MDWTELIAWIGWGVGIGRYGWGRWWRRPVPAPPDPVTDGWHCVIRDAAGVVQSIRRVRDGAVPTRLERGHGHRASMWYRLTAIDGLSVIYTPEVSPRKP